MINLLPPPYQEELKQKEGRKLILILGILFLVFLISLTLILFSAKLYIQGQLDSVKILVDLEEKTMQAAEIKDFKQKVNLTNQNILKLNEFYETQINPIDILEKVFGTLPEEITLTDFSWQKNNSQVSISGFSSTREALFNFKNNLEADKEFAEIKFPPSNWIKPVDIDFNVTFKITK